MLFNFVVTLDHIYCNAAHPPEVELQCEQVTLTTTIIELFHAPWLSAAMLLVDPAVFIGTAADLNDRHELVNHSVTHILSVDSVDPALLLPADDVFCRKWVCVLDEATSDLLSHMDDCYTFIQQAVEGGGAVLVHW